MNVTTGTRPVFVCPACGENVVATVSFRFDLGEVGDNSTIQVDAQLEGLRVAHDCIPKVKR